MEAAPWGFPSADSDYDVRFLYRHPMPWYLGLVERRDVIERPLDPDRVDVAGWDIRKALRLGLRSNPVLHEWLTSPVVFRGAPAFAAELVALLQANYSLRRVGYHYLHTAATKWRQAIEPNTLVRLKSYFYVVRPLLALAWTVEHRRILPMEIHALINGVAAPSILAETLAQIRETKRTGDEHARGARVPALDGWISERFAVADRQPPDDPAQPSLSPSPCRAAWRRAGSR